MAINSGHLPGARRHLAALLAIHNDPTHSAIEIEPPAHRWRAGCLGHRQFKVQCQADCLHCIHANGTLISQVRC